MLLSMERELTGGLYSSLDNYIYISCCSLALWWPVFRSDTETSADWKEQQGGREGRGGKELAIFPLGQITEWELQQQTIKTQQYLQLKCPFMQQDRSFHFISMQLGLLPCTHTNPHSYIHRYKKKNHAHTDTHTDTIFQTCPRVLLRNGSKQGRQERK